jgi:hypothetical protein
VNADEVLGELRQLVTDWEMADAGSDAEWSAAERMTSSFAALDDHIVHGGLLPAAWRVPLAPPSSKDPELGGQGSSSPVAYSQGQDGREFGEPTGRPEHGGQVGSGQGVSQLELDAALAQMPRRRRWRHGR